MAKTLKREIATYKKNQERLESEHLGEFILIVGEEIIGLYQSFEDASAEGIRLYGQGPYLIRQIGGPDPELPIALMLGLGSAHL